MRWQGREESENVEDERGRGGGRGMMVGGGVGALIIAVIALLSGGDPGKLLQLLQQGGNPQAAPAQPNPAHEKLKDFVGVVLKDTEDVWNTLFRQQLRKEYREPKLVLFSGETRSGCGFADAQVGPFYCPTDEKVYLDLDFFEELTTRFHAPGEFAMAYVVAHEVGHHVQKQLGFSELVQEHQGQPDYNQWSVRLELQADYLAGVWAFHAQKMKNILESGDIEAALNAAKQIGDDQLQKKASGRVMPDSFTHGSSAQRVKWFKKGIQTGDLSGMKALFQLKYSDL